MKFNFKAAVKSMLSVLVAIGLFFLYIVGAEYVRSHYGDFVGAIALLVPVSIFVGIIAGLKRETTDMGDE